MRILATGHLEKFANQQSKGAGRMKYYFDHERLEVYQIAIEFVAWSESVLESCKGKASSAKQHLDEVVKHSQ